MKTIDLTPIVGSDVLCEFSNNHEFKFRPDYWSPNIGTLREINDNYAIRFKPKERHGESFMFCRILENHWFYNDGSLVLPDGLEIKVRWENARRDIFARTRNGKIETLGHFTGALINFKEATAVKITGLADGYHY